MSARVDVLCIGEAMVSLSPGAESVRRAATLTVDVGGAEANVASSLARLGHRAAWASLLGDDPFGARIRSELARDGVVLDLVAAGAGPTGLYVKEPRADGGTVPLYYRQGSAASLMDRSDAERWAERVRPRVVHVSGITAMISVSARRLVEAVVVDRVFGDAVVSFDVNARPALAGSDAPDLLRVLARASDVVFVGRDEAAAVWGCRGADAVRQILPDPVVVVVKDAAIEAIEYGPAGIARVPALSRPVVEATGAGDAFAAGWLSAWLDGRPAVDRLREGHWLAAEAIASAGDRPVRVGVPR